MAFFVLTGGATEAAAPQYPSFTVAMTAYNAVPAQTDGDPSVTASGVASNPAVVAARSRDLAEELPFGTVIEVLPASPAPGCGLSLVHPTIGYRVIADTMNARITNTIDILFATDDQHTFGGLPMNTARVLGSCENVEIRVVGKIDISRPSTLPRSQTELASMIGASGLALK
jgi:3D (Asp-Asp-Asp) domain-containing protein